METPPKKQISPTVKPGPHSLGTLIEWKPPRTLSNFSCASLICPHSLGTLIEWKPPHIIVLRIFHH